MFIIVSTPLRIAASYAIAFGIGVVFSHQWRIRRNLIRTATAEQATSP
ncbi:hypothetical protein [Hydrogenophaga flava]|nr:hypothetical protein [Hydrogenophaga flava]